MKVTIGCDPEVFICDAKGTPVASCGLVGGTKERAKPITEHVGVLEDNVTVEFNMLHPYTDPRLMLHDLWVGIETVDTEILQPQGLRYVWADSCKFRASALKHPNARQFGCDPDQDAYKDGAMRVAPSPSALGTYRCAGGHIHFGYDKEAAGVPAFALVQFLDAFALCYDNRHFATNAQVRAKHYGKPGLFRDKPYGFEYRTPSNWWVRGSASGFLSACQKIVAGCLADPGLAQTIYDSINWKDVYELASYALEDVQFGSKHDQLREELLNYRHDLLFAGETALLGRADGIEVTIHQAIEL